MDKRMEYIQIMDYSLNKALGLKNPKLIDFRWIIEDLLKINKFL